MKESTEHREEALRHTLQLVARTGQEIAEEIRTAAFEQPPGALAGLLVLVRDLTNRLASYTAAAEGIAWPDRREGR
jgi:hypothetical protein